MRIAELSRASGVSVPSIKYYLRAGLLPAGERTAPNQADYGPAHVHRLRLIRALIDVGGLPIATISELLSVIDSRGGDDLHHVLGTALHATLPHDKTDDSADRDVVRGKMEDLAVAHDWHLFPDSAPGEALIDAATALYRFQGDEALELIEAYAELTDKLAPVEVEWAVKGETPEAAVERAVVGTIIGGAMLAAVRRLAHESASRKLFGSQSTSTRDENAQQATAPPEDLAEPPSPTNDPVRARQPAPRLRRTRRDGCSSVSAADRNAPPRALNCRRSRNAPATSRESRSAKRSLRRWQPAPPPAASAGR